MTTGQESVLVRGRYAPRQCFGLVLRQVRVGTDGFTVVPCGHERGLVGRKARCGVALSYRLASPIGYRLGTTGHEA